MEICVYGASSASLRQEYYDAAFAFGAELARRGHGLTFGGGDRGIMGAAARGAASEGGRITGVSPSFFHVDGVLYPECNELILTDTMRERKLRMDERADAFAALPGGVGTLDELFEILTLKQLGVHGKPVALLNTAGYYEPLRLLLEHAVGEGFMTRAAAEMAGFFDDPADLLDYLESASDDKRILKDI